MRELHFLAFATMTSRTTPRSAGCNQHLAIRKLCCRTKVNTTIPKESNSAHGTANAAAQSQIVALRKGRLRILRDKAT
jgi:hypothetical protein